MLLRRKDLEGVRQGTVTLAFRRWRRPTVRSGGRLRTAVGELEIRSVTRKAPQGISTGEAHRAGYASREALLAELNRRAEGDVYRIELGALRVDPRIALRAAVPTHDEALGDVRKRLDRMDARAAGGPWTRGVLEAVHAHPGVRAAELCDLVGQDKDHFKVNVRKLKNLGLTESLPRGYRLSPRGRALLEAARRVQ